MRPTHFQPLNDGSFFQSEAFTPCRQRQGFVSKGEQLSASRVPHLIGVFRPSAICQCAAIFALLAMAAGISAVIVNSVDTAAIGTRPHIGDEAFVRLHPAFANVNSSCAIESVALPRGIGAPLNHLSPYEIFGDVRHAVSRVKLAAQAPTAFGVAAVEFVGVDPLLASALTLTNPVGVFQRAFLFSHSDNCESPKFLAGEVFELWGAPTYALFSHDVSFQTRTLWIEPARVTSACRLASCAVHSTAFLTLITNAVAPRVVTATAN